MTFSIFIVRIPLIVVSRMLIAVVFVVARGGEIWNAGLTYVIACLLASFPHIPGPERLSGIYASGHSFYYSINYEH